MKHRHPTGTSDPDIFSRTARKTKKINVAPKLQRGGTRL